MDLKEAVIAFRKTEWFRLTYLLLLALVVAALAPSAGGSAICLVFLLMPVTMFVIPYWLGERKVKRLGVNGLVVFTAATVLVAVFFTQAILGAPAFALSSEGASRVHPSMALSNGTVSPYRTDAGGRFNFTVTLTTPNASVPSDPDNYTVYLIVLVVDAVDVLVEAPVLMTPAIGNDTLLGVQYAANRDLGAAIYGFAFNATDRRGNWTETWGAYGPITAGWGTFYGVFLVRSAGFLLLPILFYYFFIFMWWYSFRAKETRRKMLGGRGKEGEEGSKPASRARAGKIAEFTCTSCGADVSEDDAKCSKCGAVFED